MIVDRKKEIRHLMGAQSPDSYRRLFESLATGEDIVSIPISNKDRLLRLGIGAIMVMLAWMYATWWLLPIGLLVIFWGIHDRCPIWQAISARFKRKL